MVADNGVNNAKYYGDVDARPMEISDEGDAYKNRFVVTDTDGLNQVKLAGVGAKFYEVRGIISNKAGIKNGNAGTTALPYKAGDVVSVRMRGNTKIECVDSSGIVDGSPIVAAAGGKAAKYAAPTAIGDTSVGDESANIQGQIDAMATILAIACGEPDANNLVAIDFIRRN